MTSTLVSDSPTAVVTAWLDGLGADLDRHDAAAAANRFEEEGFWRDLVAFTWNIKTLEGRAAIRDMLDATLAHTRPTAFRLEGEATNANGLCEGWFTFETATARGRGHLRLREGRCWTLLTTMAGLIGHEESSGARRPRGVEHVARQGRPTWQDERATEARTLGYSEQPYVVILGGGQNGIALAARLRRLAVPTLVLEKNARAGDSWRNRYQSLCLHDPVWYDHMPFLPFPDHWPVFTPKDKMGDWLESYVRTMEINYWTSTEVTGALFDEASNTWEVQAIREGVPLTLWPTQLVFATGASGFPQVPAFPGAADFRGTQHHSSRHAGGEAWKGKRCVVIGSNNSAHDICADLWEHGADVTMVQRSSTLVAKSATLMDLAFGGLYSEEAVKAGVDTATADLIFASVPYKVLPALHTPLYQQIAERDADLYERLRKAGFLLDFGEDGSGLSMKYFRRGSGYYIDVGASELVADGRIKLRSGVGVERIKADRVVLSDGSELPADLIVYATGYGHMNEWVHRLVSPEAAAKVGKCWGLGSDTTRDPGPWEGELRNMWKPTAHHNLWFQGGNLHQARHYSQFLALQLKARMERIATPVYGQQAVHHVR